MNYTGLRHISLKTRDLEKTKAFWVVVLGLKPAFGQPPKRVFLHSPGGRDLIDFVKSKEKLDPNSGLDHFGFKVSRAVLKQIEKRLIENNVPIEGRRGRDSFYFRDPNGYSVEFYCD